MYSRGKDLFTDILKSRLIVLVVFFCALFLVLVHRLFTLQIINGEDYLKDYTLSIQKTKEVQGTRGNIYDRDGELLATNRLAYSVTIEDDGAYEDNDHKNTVINDTINRVIDIIEKHGDSVVDNFGIVLEDDEFKFVYAEGYRRSRFIADVYGYGSIDTLSEDEINSSPKDIIDFLCAKNRKTKEGSSYGFGIDQDEYTKERLL